MLKRRCPVRFVDALKLKLSAEERKMAEQPH